MAIAYLMPYVRPQFFDSNGVEAVGYKLYVCAAGTTTLITSWTDSGQVTPNPNPIVLNARGEPDNSGTPIDIYTAQTAKFVLASPTSTGPTDGSVWTRDNIQVSDGGLRADLANSTDTTKGSALVAYKDSITGSVSTNLSAYLNLKVKGLKKTFGCVGDGVTDDLAKINSAFASSNKIIEIEDATFLMSANPSVPVCAGIVGFGSNISILKLAGGGTLGLSITGANAPTRLIGFRVSGNVTAAARGLVLGDGLLTNVPYLQDVAVYSFTGAGAIGVDCRDIVTAQLVNCYINGNMTNVRFTVGAVAGTPTTVQFIGGDIRSALGVGCEIDEVHTLTFEGTVFENNTNEGCYIGKVAAQVAVQIDFNNCWFEGNWAANAAMYQLVVDGTIASTVYARIHGGQFNGAANSVNFTGVNARNCYVADVSLPAGAAQIIIQNNAQVALGPNMDLSKITNTSPYVANLWTSYVPVYASSIGNAAATFNGAVTTTFMSYRFYNGQTVIRGIFSATLNAVTPSYISLTVPTGVVVYDSNTSNACEVLNNAAYEAGKVKTDQASSTLRITRAGRVNFTSASAIAFEFQIVING